MRRRPILSLLLLLVVLPAPASAAPAKPDPAIARAGTELAVDLYRKLGATPGNLFFSPSSIYTALAMVTSGARGQTARQLERALRLKLAGSGLREQRASLEAANGAGVQLSIANALWGQRGHSFLPAFLEELKTNFHSPLESVDFRTSAEKARVSINRWVEKVTRERIKDLLPPRLLSELTRLVLVSAIYFKGSWASPFDKAFTRSEPFYLAGGKQVKVPLMMQSTRARLAASKDVQVLELPYKGDRLAMVVLLPVKRDGLPALERQLSRAWLEARLASLKAQEVEIWLPRFKLTQAIMLVPTLEALGIKDLFKDRVADLSGIDGTRALHISAAVHKAFVEVNELGTEAAAATAMAASGGGPPPKRPEVRVDHPCVFLIRDRVTGTILFLGRLAEPSA